MFGVLIEKGPQDWQIFQQRDGEAEICAEGTFVIPEDMDLPQPVVYLRIVREDNGLDVTCWQPAEIIKENHWRISLKIPVGGLYRLESCMTNAGDIVLEWARRGDMRHHLGVGDLYVIAGQSNSAGYGKDPFYDPPELGVHLLRNSLRWDLATHPMNDSTNSAHPVNTEGANPGASPYLSFAKMLKRELGYPIGLLQTSLGGSPLSAWNPEEDGCLYRSMMEVISSQGRHIKGVLWYQGCNDAILPETEAPTYLERFGKMVDAFRRELGDAVPWLTVQLNRRMDNGETSDDCGWGMVREAQRQAARIYQGISVIPASDCGLSDAIHNSAAANVMLGERLAAAALRDIYGRQYSSAAPDLEQAVLQEPQQLALKFSHVAGRLYAFDSVRIAKQAFTVCDCSGCIPVEKMECVGDTLLLTLSRPAGEECLVSGGWQAEPSVLMPIDFASHLPILSFYQVAVCSK